MPDPVVTERNGPARADVRRAGLAYACHGWIALVLVAAFVLDRVYGSPSSPEALSRWQGIGMLLILPLVMSTFVAAFLALKLTWRLRGVATEARPLWLLWLSLAALLGAWVLHESRLVPAWFGGLAALQYVLLTALVTVRRLRRDVTA